jgi:glycosyltransferase involved in cell wall biosynthesis
LAGEFGRAGVPDVIHANGTSALNVVAPVARRFDVPVLVHVHASRVSSESRVALKSWLRLGTRIELLPVSEFSRGLLEGAGIDRYVSGVLPNPVETRFFDVERRPRDSRFRVGFVGLNDPMKGLHLLIDIADQLRDEPIEWRVYGTNPDQRGEYLQRCLAEIAKRDLWDVIRWQGKIDDASQAYAEMDVLLVPSLRESFSRVAAEGMATGLPVVAARSSGLSEVVWEDVSGLFFDRALPDLAGEHIRHLMADEGFRMRLAEGARRAARRFDITRVGPMLEEHYRRVARI